MTYSFSIFGFKKKLLFWIGNIGLWLKKECGEILASTNTHPPSFWDNTVAGFSVSFQRFPCRGQYSGGKVDIPLLGTMEGRPSRCHWWFNHYKLRVVPEWHLALLSNDCQEERLNINSSIVKHFWQTNSSICLAHIQILIEVSLFTYQGEHFSPNTFILEALSRNYTA